MAYKPLVTGLVLLFLFGGIIPLILSPFAPAQVTGVYGGINSMIDFGFTILNSYNFIPFLPNVDFTTLHNFISNQLNGFSIIPEIIGLPILIIIGSLLTYGLLELVRGN